MIRPLSRRAATPLVRAGASYRGCAGHFVRRCSGACATRTVIVAGADARRLLDTPQFEVLGPVVVTAPVLVMHAFMWLKVTAEDLFHYENVLKNVRPLPRGARVVGCEYLDVSTSVLPPATLPRGRSLARGMDSLELASAAPRTEALILPPRLEGLPAFAADLFGSTTLVCPGARARTKALLLRPGLKLHSAAPAVS